MDRRLLKLLGGGKTTALGSIDLHLISAYALLQAKAEAETLAKAEPQALGLYLNACILARAAKKDGKPVWADGQAVMQALPAERIGQWMARYLALCAQVNPSCCSGDPEELKQALRQAPYERLKWRVLRAFGVLPSEQRAREMTDGDYLYCVLQLTLDEEDQLEQLCPQCREEALEARCPICGTSLDVENPRFEESRFEELKRDGLSGGAAVDADGSGSGTGGGTPDGTDGAFSAPEQAESGTGGSV